MYKFLRNMAQPCEIYLSRANRHVIGKLNVNRAKLHVQLLNIWELTIDVPKGNNHYYDSIKQYMEICVPNVGWFRINGHPTEYLDYTTGLYYKSVVAYGYEVQLRDIDLNLFYINTGEPLSMEMYEENLDALGIPKHNIQFYIDNAVEDVTSSDYWGLGLLNIIEHEYLKQKGWTIGHVDTALKGLRGRIFQIDSQDVYSFLTQEAAKSYKCVFIFDTIKKTINAYQVENLGKYLNIELNRRNLLNSVTIESQRDYSYTQFQVAGGNDETTISYVNFGSETIENLSYYIANGQLSPDYLDRYNSYVEYRESRRDEYADTVRQYLILQQKIDVIHQQIPIDECATRWSSYTTEELETELEQFQKLQEALEQAHTVDGVLQIEETPDYATYISIKEAIIPSIQQILDARAAGEAEQELDYKVNWKLYGIDELTVLKKNYENQVSLLAEKGYDKPWVEGNDGNKETHTKHHEDYLLYQKYVEEITARIDELTAKVEEYQAQADELEELRKSIANDVNIENSRFGFSQKELSDIYSLYITTAFTDSSIEVQSMDDIDAVIELSKELLESAKKELDIESRPQLRFSVDTENPFLLEKFSSVFDDMDVGDFIYLDLDDSGQSNWRSRKPVKVKQRIIGYTIELVDLSDTSCEFEFSDMVHCYGNAADDEYLLGTGRSSQKNSVSRAVSNYVNQVASTIAMQVLMSYLSGGNSVFLGDLSPEDLQKLADQLEGLVNGTLSLDELTAKVAKIEKLEADCAFVRYLHAESIVANEASFNSVNAEVARINTILGGTGSFENGQFINLTVDNVKINTAVVSDLIAPYITVLHLQGGDITLSENMQIISDNGKLTMNGEAIQISGKDSEGNDYVAIQLGYDTQNNPSLIIRNETGAVMLDAQGLHEDIVPNGLIKNDMIANGTIDKDKFKFINIEEDPDGVMHIADVYVNNKGNGAKYISIGKSIDGLSTTMSGIESTVNAVDKSIKDAVWKTTIIDVQNENGEIVGKQIQDILVQNTTDINGIRSSVKELTTTKGEDGMTFVERTNDFIQTSKTFQSTVEETYLQTTDVGARNLLRNSKTLIYKDYELYKLS